MSESRYVFSNAWEMADRRLEALELEHDPTTKRRALATGLKSGWRCLEVGAGRGSIVRWLSDVVGSSGHVSAVDIDTRFLDELSSGNVEVHRLDVVNDALPIAQFDFVHTRVLLMHLPERGLAEAGIGIAAGWLDSLRGARFLPDHRCGHGELQRCMACVHKRNEDGRRQSDVGEDAARLSRATWSPKHND